MLSFCASDKVGRLAVILALESRLHQSQDHAVNDGDVSDRRSGVDDVVDIHHGSTLQREEKRLVVLVDIQEAGSGSPCARRGVSA